MGRVIHIDRRRCRFHGCGAAARGLGDVAVDALEPDVSRRVGR